MESVRLLSTDEQIELDTYRCVELTYSSCALAGSQLTLADTKIVVESQITVAGRTLRDTFRAADHTKAYDYMLDALAYGFGDADVSEKLILTLHQLACANIEGGDVAGKYRDHQILIANSEYIPPPADEVGRLMAEFIKELDEKAEKEHPIVLATFAHRRLLDILPFVWGNGTVARLLMNFILMRHRYQIVSIPPVMREEYRDALRTAQEIESPSDDLFLWLVAEQQLKAQQAFCRMFWIELPHDEVSPCHISTQP